MTSFCKWCSKDKDPYAFRYSDKQTDRFLKKCIDCRRQYQTSYYAKNIVTVKEKIKKHVVKRSQENKDKLCAYLKEHPCVECGNRDIRVLECDHIRGIKKYGVGAITRLGMKWDTIYAEIQKCEVVCANCHRIRTVERAGSYRSKYDAVVERLLPQSAKLLRESSSLSCISL